MKMVVIYDKPKDFPDEIVGREWDAFGPKEIVVRGTKMGEVRSKLEELYPDKVYLLRSDDDDPTIVGVYI